MSVQRYNFEAELNITIIVLKLLIINGPNLNLLGKREPLIYGVVSFETQLEKIRKANSDIEILYYQTNLEGEIINRLHAAEEENFAGIILNAGGYSHTSVAIADAVAAISTPVLLLHISNIYHREVERHKELSAKYALGGIYGLGLQGYDVAVNFFKAQQDL